MHTTITGHFRDNRYTYAYTHVLKLFFLKQEETCKNENVFNTRNKSNKYLIKHGKRNPSPGKQCFPRIILYPRYKSASSQELSIYNLPFMIKETQLCTFRPIVFISLNKKLVNSHDKICYSLYAVNNYLRYLHLNNDCACKAFCTCNNFKNNYVSK